MIQRVASSRMPSGASGTAKGGTMLATLVAVLALAGAPASTRVECAPYLDATRVLAVTVGDTFPGPLSHVFLGTGACGALLYTSSSPSERAAFRRLNPRVDFDALVG